MLVYGKLLNSIQHNLILRLYLKEILNPTFYNDSKYMKKVPFSSKHAQIRENSYNNHLGHYWLFIQLGANLDTLLPFQDIIYSYIRRTMIAIYFVIMPTCRVFSCSIFKNINEYLPTVIVIILSTRLSCPTFIAIVVQLSRFVNMTLCKFFQMSVPIRAFSESHNAEY